MNWVSTAILILALAAPAIADEAPPGAWGAPCALGDMMSAPNCLHTTITATTSRLPSCPTDYQLVLRANMTPACARDVIDAQ